MCFKTPHKTDQTAHSEGQTHHHLQVSAEPWRISAGYLVKSESRRFIIHPFFTEGCECAVSGSLPQEHLAGSTVGVLIKRVHLEVVLIGCGSLRLDVGPG